MVGPTFEQQLRNLLRSMHDQGILDHHFENVRRLQAHGNPHFLTEVITMFVNDADGSMGEITRLINQPELDYETLGQYLHQLRGSSASIGGCRMANACREFRQAVDARDKERCINGFHGIRHEYRDLRACFDSILQIQRSIIEYENRRRQP
ncbi:histidine-containing phosphotransfer protein 2-like [Mangifera indica]|uniref:histidine-containing phosphotransfer protein 2-like n=1 Tax=Mangifera indica TaxID=29780 RepID=UPI001CF9F187|nr:histidine-containing phosphotransfer protein 2-like [Mangifera indica]